MIFARFTLSVVIASSIISFSRCMALWNYYHAPMTALFKFEQEELPRLLNVTGILPMDTVDHDQRVDLTPIKSFNLKLCLGKEWHRFPGNYLVPDGVSVEFIKSEFKGLLPGHFINAPADVSPTWWLQPGTRIVPEHQNDLNEEEPSRYVGVVTLLLRADAYLSQECCRDVRLSGGSRLSIASHNLCARTPLCYR